MGVINEAKQDFADEVRSKAFQEIIDMIDGEIQDGLMTQKEGAGNQHLKGYILALRVMKDKIENWEP
jgi:hypothetical protein